MDEEIIMNSIDEIKNDLKKTKQKYHDTIVLPAIKFLEEQGFTKYTADTYYKRVGEFMVYGGFPYSLNDKFEYIFQVYYDDPYETEIVDESFESFDEFKEYILNFEFPKMQKFELSATVTGLNKHDAIRRFLSEIDNRINEENVTEKLVSLL